MISSGFAPPPIGEGGWAASVREAESRVWDASAAVIVFAMNFRRSTKALNC